MGARISKTESSNSVGTAGGLHTKFARLFGEICRLAPEFCILRPSDPPFSVSLTISTALNLNPAYSDCPDTLALVFLYFEVSIYAPLLYLALVKHLIDDGDGDDKTVKVLAPELAEGSPFKDMSAGELLQEIREGRGPFMKGLKERKYELDEKLRFIKKRKRAWKAADSALSIALLVVTLVALVAATVPPVTIPALYLLVIGVKVVDPCFSMMADEYESKLESLKDAIEAMRRGRSSALLLLLLLPNLEHIREHVENLRKDRVSLRDVETEQKAMAMEEAEAVGQTAALVEREVKKKKKKVQQGIEAVRKLANQVEGEVKKVAAEFLNIIAD